jgi:hypothetical protein
LLVALAKKQLGLERSLYEILQILSVSAFEETPINQLFAASAGKLETAPIENHLYLPGILTGQ